MSTNCHSRRIECEFDVEFIPLPDQKRDNWEYSIIEFARMAVDIVSQRKLAGDGGDGDVVDNG